MLPAVPPTYSTMPSTVKATFSMWTLSGRMWSPNLPGKSMMRS